MNGEKKFCDFVLDYYLTKGSQRGNIDIMLKEFTSKIDIEEFKKKYGIRKGYIDSFVISWFEIRKKQYENELKEKLDNVINKVARKEENKKELIESIDKLAEFLTILEFLAISVNDRKLFKEYLLIKNVIEENPIILFKCYKDSKILQHNVEEFINVFASKKIKYHLPIVIKRLKDCLERERKKGHNVECNVDLRIHKREIINR
jgi:hypothetical protein